MKKKQVFALILATMMASSMSMTALAGSWEQDVMGWWYLEDDGSFASDGWKEIDGKQYYFDSQGHMLQDTITPDGYKVGSDGAKIDNGIEISRYGDYALIHSSRMYGTQPAVEEDYIYDGTEKYVLSNQNPYPYVLDYCIKGRIGEEVKDPNIWYMQDYDPEYHIEFSELEDNKWVSYWCADASNNRGSSYIGIINQWISFVDNDTFTVTTEGRNYEHKNYVYIDTFSKIK